MIGRWTCGRSLNKYCIERRKVRGEMTERLKEARNDGM